MAILTCSTLHLAVQCNESELFIAAPILKTGTVSYGYNQLRNICNQQGSSLPDGGGTKSITPPPRVTPCVYKLIQPYADKTTGEAGNIWSEFCDTQGGNDLCTFWVVHKDGNGNANEIRQSVGKAGNKHFIYPVCERSEYETVCNVMVVIDATRTSPTKQRQPFLERC